jgi:4-alpha-glucanotransferase
MPLMTSTDQAARAAAAGVATGYLDQQGRAVQSSTAAIERVLGLLGSVPPTAAAPEVGRLPAWPARRGWGLSCYLPGLRSAGSWGVGDAVDLASIATLGGRLGADAVLLNPTTAELPVAPIDPSPYLPASRVADALWLLRPDAVPEFDLLNAGARARIAELAAGARAASAELLDSSAVFAAKWEAVRLLAPAVIGERRHQRERFAAERPHLTAFADWWQHVARFGPNPADWPAPPPPAPEELRNAVISAQFWIDEQLAAAQQAARAAGMRVGLFADLPVGVHPLGFDPWHLGGVMVRGAAVGAPPDAYNALGQNWSQPPWHPQRLAAAEAEPFAAAVDHALRHAGGLRVDHILGLFRSWWIPDGHPADDGVYVTNPSAAMLAALVRTAGDRGAVVVGEDLGTVGPEVRRSLADAGLLGTELAIFAADATTGEAPTPERMRPGVLAALSTHDLPTASGWLLGEHLALRQRLGLLPDVAAAAADWHRERAGWRARLRTDGWWQPVAGADPDGPEEIAEQVLGWHRWLAATAAPLVAVQVADAVGDRRPVNMPGTVAEYPNWRLPVTDAAGTPVSVEKLADSADLARTAAAVAAERS